MSSFDYLKSAIKQKGCTLQQVAEASGMTKGYLSQLLNAKIKSPSVSSGWSFPAGRKASAWCLVSFTRCIPGISI